MFLEHFLGIRIKEEHYKQIKEICQKDTEKYDNESHFVRCAIIKLIREELKTKKREKK